MCGCVHLHVCMNECPLNLRLCPLSTLFLPSHLHTLNLLRPLSILFQMSFLHLLSLLTGHSVSCKPSLSTNIPLFIKYSFCCEPSVSIQPNMSNEHFVSDVCTTEPGIA